MAAAYASSFARLCAGAVAPLLAGIEQAAIPGTRLLDVGTGTGTVAAAAADRGFKVEGVDAETTMLDFARRAHSGISFREGRLPNLPYPAATFGAATANFVLNHTRDPRASVRDIARVLQPGSPLGMTIWPATISPMNVLMNDVIEQAGARRLDGTRLPPEKGFERTEAGLRSLMEEGGFGRVEVHEISWTFDIAPGDLWRAVSAGIANMGAIYLAQDDLTRGRMRDAFDDLTGSMAEGGELHLPTTALLAQANA